MKPLNLSNMGATRPMSDTSNMLAIAIGATESSTVPSGATFVVISADVAVTVRPGAAPAAFGDVTDGTAGQLIMSGDPQGFDLDGVTVIHVRAGAVAANVTFSYYGRS